MKIKADTKTVSIENEEKLTSGALNNVTLEVELSKEYKGLTAFVTFNETEIMVVGNMVDVPTLKSGACRIGVYAVETVNDETVLRYSPSPATIFVSSGTFNKNLHIDPPTQSEADRIYSLINKAIEEGKLKGDKGDTGEQGPKGEQGLSERTIIDKNDNAEITLNDNTEYRRGTVKSLSLSFPNSLSEPYYTAVIFNTITDPSVTINHSGHPLINNKLVMQGDDCKLEKFTPLANKHYHIVFCWDGEYMIGRVNANEVAI